MSAKTNYGKGHSPQVAKTKINIEAALRSNTPLGSDNGHKSTPPPDSVSEPVPQSDSNLNREWSQELTEATAHDNPTRSIFFGLKTRTAAILAAGVVMLPILAVGTATYYFGSRTLDKQLVLAKRGNNLSLAAAELARERQLLAALLIGTGTTALLAGATAAWGTRKLSRKISAFTSELVANYTEKLEPIQLSQSALQQKILRETVAEARTYLECDRVVVYGLDRDRYGEIVAESVAAGYTQALGSKIEDPCFEMKYLEKYRNGRVRAIADVNTAELTSCYTAQLQQLEVKANLVTPVIDDGKLFGLLVAHQCQAPRQWQRGEIAYLSQLASKTGLALANAELQESTERLQTQAARERKWTNYFTNAVRNIRQSLQEADVLEISVEEVRRVLKCDRVVVYSLNQEQYGVVTAESVAAGYTRALHKTIVDPCFAAKYLDKYRDGRVRAIANIDEAGMSECYHEQLATLEVKANLVTPILDRGQLFGLLVAHQCQAPRHWQDYEIRWVTQIATQVGFALDNAKVLTQAKNYQSIAERERKWTHYFIDAVRNIRQSLQQADVLEISVEEVRRVLQCDRVVVYSLDQQQYGVVVAESVAPGYTRALRKTIVDPCFAAKYLDKYRDGRVRAIDNIDAAGMSECYREQLATLQVKANLVTPILNQGQLFGLLVAHQCSEPRHWQDYEIRWVTQIATQVGFALDNAVLLQKLELEQLSVRSLNNFSIGINERVDRTELLEVAVEQARKLMKLDRVAVYQFATEGDGEILAESVLPDFPQAIASPLPSYFASQYGAYQRGKIEAIAEIERAEPYLEPYLKQLISLAVKSSLVVPVLQGDRLFGLLIAHQCQQPRLWSQSEIELVTQLALQLGFALDRVKLQQLEHLPHTQEDLVARAIQLAQLPLAEISVEASELTLTASHDPEPETITGELVDADAPTDSSTEGLGSEITDLSDRITQQSSHVTESLQKLAAFAKQLSENEKS